MHTRPDKLRPRVVLLYSVVIVAIGAFAMAVPYAKEAMAAAAASQQPPEDRNTPPKAVVERTTAIKAELKQPRTQPWAGDYYQGDGEGANIRLLLAPRAGVAATWHGCLGLYGSNEGSIQPNSDGSLRLGYNSPNTERFGGFPDQVLPVQWSGRRYLIEPTQLIDFVSAINRGMEPRHDPHGMFLLARGDAALNVEGLPLLPPGWAERIRRAAATARVVSATVQSSKRSFQSFCETTYRLQLEVAGAGPLQLADELKSSLPENRYETLRITSVSSRHPVGVMTVFGECAKPDPAPDQHWVFSTGAYDPVAANQKIDEARKRRAAEDSQAR